MIITSFSNPRIKTIRKLEQKKYRQDTGLFFVEGLRTVGEAVQTGAKIESLIISPDLLESQFGKSLLDHPNIEGVEQIQVSAEIYEKLAHKDGPQGMGALIHQNLQALDAITVNQEDFWVALASVADPGNLGTIMRTADATGCRGIILLGQSTDPYDPTAVKASMGALFSLILIQSTWDEFSKWLQKNRLSLVGTSDHAETDYQAVKYSHPLVLLMGSERHGLSKDMMNACDFLVKIPMVGRSDSLNLSVATGILIYEIFNQSRQLE
jgi:TrmH family RNA methyltransferase